MTVDELRAIINNPAVKGSLTVVIPDDMALAGHSEAFVAAMAKDESFVVEEVEASEAEFFYIGQGV